MKDLYIRGDVDDSVVICTNDTTYDVKLCQTSNQLLVIPDSITPKQGIFLKLRSGHAGVILKDSSERFQSF